MVVVDSSASSARTWSAAASASAGGLGDGRFDGLSDRSGSGAGFSLFGLRTGFFFSSAWNSTLASLVFTVLVAFLSPLKIPQSPVSLRMASTCGDGWAPTPSQYSARSDCDLDERGLLGGVVLADLFDDAAVALGARVGDDDAVIRRTDLAHALQTNFDSHNSPELRVLVANWLPWAWGTRGWKL